MNWSTESVLNLAPDPATGKRAEALATTRKWQELQGNTKAIWGLCQGSGSASYNTQVDLQGPAFRCSCPSRQFPCKHSIGLLLLFVTQSDAFRITDDYPQWVQEWLDKRANKLSNQPTPDKQAAQLAQKTKTRDKRMTQMASGLEDLHVWLTDLIQRGLAETEKQDVEFWNSFAARMVDMRLGGVARRIRHLPLLQYTAPKRKKKKGKATAVIRQKADWPQHMLAAIGELHLISQGFEQLDDLPEALQAELLSVAGINTRKEEVLQQIGVTDDWLVLGVEEGNEDQLNFRRAWLQGQQSGQMALLLDYVHQSMEFPDRYYVSGALSGELVFYPAAYRQRALVKEKRSLSLSIDSIQSTPDIARFQQDYAQAIATNPWLYRFPLALGPVTPAMDNKQLYLVDRDHKAIPVSYQDQIWWQLLALSGGNSLEVFGEWDGMELKVLSVFADGRLVGMG